MDKTHLFEYKCPECGRGSVRTTRVQNYKTKIKGYPFVVDEAIIGICDSCGAKHFVPEETKRWEELYYRSLEQRQAFLSSMEIGDLRKRIGLSMEDFARLIGCTRQSIYNWEKVDRTFPPSRMADLLMKLVRESLSNGKIDVLAFLLEEVKKWGAILEVRRVMTSANDNTSIILKPRLVTSTVPTQQGEQYALAAKTTLDEEELILETLDGKVVGGLEYDYQLAALVLSLTGEFIPWKVVDAEIETQDGQHLTNQGLSVQERRLVLMEKTKMRGKDISQITLKRHYGEARG
jgi:putative zinc finger/helix-turn-helix YgiT family protein